MYTCFVLTSVPKSSTSDLTIARISPTLVYSVPTWETHCIMSLLIYSISDHYPRWEVLTLSRPHRRDTTVLAMNNPRLCIRAPSPSRAPRFRSGSHAAPAARDRAGPPPLHTCVGRTSPRQTSSTRTGMTAAPGRTSNARSRSASSASAG
ncbi:hypothetical protein C2E23DRAFT_418700 [Lenzites betulinus]|nr:hypothetical protein C2E23DRAFT_418700 [Lenzites betulinus]